LITLPHSSRSLFFPSSSISLSSIASLFRLHSVFLSVPFSASLSFRRIRSTCVRSSHCPRVTSCTFSLLLPSHSCSLSLLVPTSESRHNFSLSHTLSSLPIVLRFSHSFSSLLLIRVFVPLPFYSPSPYTFSRRVVFSSSPSSRIVSSVYPLSLSSYLNHSPFIYIFLYPILILFRHLYTSSHLFFPSTYPYLA
jgi:hypothetical protein